MTTLGKYELHEQLGRGGFGIVYRATDTTLSRDVALKVLHPQLTIEPDFIQRFRNEARLVASLRSPNIVTIHELGEVNGRVFIAMEYLPGGSLKDRLEKTGPIPFDESLEIMKQVCAGLETAHKKGLVHRDIKPGNILFDEEGHAVIGDFGLARAIQLSSVSNSSSTGGVGTPAYRAPELWLGEPPANPATDIYSIGCVLSEMLTNKTLFQGKTTEEILTHHLITGPDFPLNYPVGVPGEIRGIIEKAVSKDQKTRYGSITEFIEAFRGEQPKKEVKQNFFWLVPIILAIFFGIWLFSKQTKTDFINQTMIPSEIGSYEYTNDENIYIQPSLTNEKTTRTPEELSAMAGKQTAFATVQETEIAYFQQTAEQEKISQIIEATEKAFEETQNVFYETQTARSWTETPTLPFTKTPTITDTPVPTDTPDLNIGLIRTLSGKQTAFANVQKTVNADIQKTATQEEMNRIISETEKAFEKTQNTFNLTQTAFSWTKTPTLNISSTRIREKDGMVMVYVPAGEFEMGSDDVVSYAKPVHTVYLDDYWIDRTEVTNEQYESCVAAGICTVPVNSDDNYFGSSTFANYPMIYVEWNQAVAYCKWAGVRLPTEAEWEKAARGTDGRIYPWGNERPDKNLANYGQNIGDTTEVGSYPVGVSPYGALDMAGNVWEWVLDWYAEDYYSKSPDRNPIGPLFGMHRVLRGGSYGNDDDLIRSVVRLRFHPSAKDPGIGFRCAYSE